MGVYEIHQKYLNKDYEIKLKLPRRSLFNDTHIFDEEKSVKWNREEVLRQNEIIKSEVELYELKKYGLREQLYNDIIEAILEDFDVNEEQAKQIYSKAYADKHSYFSDVFSDINELGDFYESMRKLESTSLNVK